MHERAETSSRVAQAPNKRPASRICVWMLVLCAIRGCMRLRRGLLLLHHQRVLLRGGDVRGLVPRVQHVPLMHLLVLLCVGHVAA